MDVSVIVVNYHSEDLIKECVKSVSEKTNGISFEIIVVDNESDEQGKVALKSLPGDCIKTIDARMNLGFGKANNLGAEYACGKYLFLLNPDTVLMNNAIKILYDFMEMNKNVGVCGGNLFSPDGNPTPSFCKEFDTLETEIKKSKWIGIISQKVNDVIGGKIHSNMNTFNYTDAPMEVAYIFGADMMIKKELFDSVGGFDRDFFMYAEEAELQNRISRLGYHIVCVPQAKIIHLEGATSAENNGRSTKQFAMRMKGKLTYFDKCFPPDGADKFYKYRRLKLSRLLQWQKIRGRKPSSETIDILDRIYAEYCSERGS